MTRVSMTVCCRCNSSGRCVSCICVRKGTPCVNCLPLRRGRCQNAGSHSPSPAIAPDPGSVTTSTTTDVSNVEADTNHESSQANVDSGAANSNNEGETRAR